MVQVHSLTVFFICYLMAEVTVGDKLPPPLVSPSCKEIGICEVANYPTLLARKLIQELKNNNTIFTSDSKDDIREEFGKASYQLHNYHTRRIYDIRYDNPMIYRSGFFNEPWLGSKRFSNNRFINRYNLGKTDGEIKLCESTEQYISPLYAENGNNTWEVILNDQDHPVQTYRYVTCKNSNSRCSKKLIPGAYYEAKCIQKWTFKEMYYIDKEGQLAIDYFKVPTCCSCKLFHTN